MKCRKNTESKNPKSCKDKNRQNNAFLCSECEMTWHDMAYGDFKDLTKRTASDKILCDNAFNIAEIWKMVDIKVV